MEEYYIINAALIKQDLIENILCFVTELTKRSQTFDVGGYKLKKGYFETTYDSLYDDGIETFQLKASDISELREILKSNIFSDIIFPSSELASEIRLSLSQDINDQLCLSLILDSQLVNNMAPTSKVNFLEKIATMYFAKIRCKYGNGSTESSCLDSEKIDYPEEYQREDLYYLPPDVKINIDRAKYREIELAGGNLYIRVS